MSVWVSDADFPPDVVDRVIRRTGPGQMRNRQLPSRLIVYYVMAMACSPPARTDAISVLVIEYTITSGESTRDFRLITSILDPGAASAQDLADLHGRPWEIES